MKKTLAIVLTLALLVTVAAPVFAAEDAIQSFICPRCSGTAYEDYCDTSYQYKAVSSCILESLPHEHRIYGTRCYATCADCDYTFLVSSTTHNEYCLSKGQYV